MHTITILYYTTNKMSWELHEEWRFDGCWPISTISTCELYGSHTQPHNNILSINIDPLFQQFSLAISSSLKTQIKMKSVSRDNINLHICNHHFILYAQRSKWQWFKFSVLRYFVSKDSRSPNVSLLACLSQKINQLYIAYNKHS